MAVASKQAGGSDAGAQSAFARQPVFDTGIAEGLVHPVAGPALFGAEEINSLEGEFLPDQVREVEASGKDVPAGAGGSRLCQVEFLAQRLEDLHGKEGHLSLIVFAMIEIPVATQSTAGDALNFHQFDQGMGAGGHAVMTDVIVSGRNEQVFDGNFHDTSTKGGA